jgi:hypothetical protein
VALAAFPSFFLGASFFLGEAFFFEAALFCAIFKNSLRKNV